MPEQSPRLLRFPAGFRWSVASSAHQVEGGNDNSDWWEFEARPGAIKRGERSGKACDHWHRVDEDVALVKSLHMNHARISVEWARIEPAPGRIDQAALAHYRKELELLKAAGIESLVTFHHFTLPKWVAAKGGWGSGDVPAAFARYCGVVYDALGDLVRDWITINEPMVVIVAGYLSGDFPPGERDPKKIAAPLRGLIRGHALAYRAVHERAEKAGRTVRLGVAHHLRVIDPARAWHLVDRLAAATLDKAFNWVFPDALRTGRLEMKLPFLVSFRDDVPEAKGTEDFFGLNYYSRDLIRFAPRHRNRFVRVDRPDQWRSDLGWEIYPAGIYQLLKQIAARYPNTPVMITENGLADAEDKSRAKFIQTHLAEIHRAISEGVPVEGYSHWSLLDNFEWAEGFSPRFGLCRMDYSSMVRTPRKSAEVYARIARENAVETC